MGNTEDLDSSKPDWGFQNFAQNPTTSCSRRIRSKYFVDIFLYGSCMFLSIPIGLCQHKNVSIVLRHTSKPDGSTRWSWRSAWLQRRDNRFCVLLPRRASQFDPPIDKERVYQQFKAEHAGLCLDSSKCAASGAAIREERLNSRYAQKSTIYGQ